jgi:hypothetical protein
LGRPSRSCGVVTNTFGRGTLLYALRGSIFGRRLGFKFPPPFPAFTSSGSNRREERRHCRRCERSRRCAAARAQSEGLLWRVTSALARQQQPCAPNRLTSGLSRNDRATSRRLERWPPQTTPSRRFEREDIKRYRQRRLRPSCSRSQRRARSACDRAKHSRRRVSVPGSRTRATT